MNGKKAKALRAVAGDKKTYKHLKKELGARGRCDASQKPIFPKERTHKAKPAQPQFSSSWKRNAPPIVLRPVRALVRKLLACNFPDENGVRTLTAEQRFTIRCARYVPSYSISALVNTH